MLVGNSRNLSKCLLDSSPVQSSMLCILCVPIEVLRGLSVEACSGTMVETKGSGSSMMDGVGSIACL